MACTGKISNRNKGPIVEEFKEYLYLCRKISHDEKWIMEVRYSLHIHEMAECSLLIERYLIHWR